MKTEERMPLMDQVHAMTFMSKLGGKRPIPDAARRTLTKYRMLLRRAQRFVVDDDAAKLICHLSHEHGRLDNWSFLARLPYPVVWLEYNLHAKVAEFEAMGSLGARFRPEEVSPVMGYLLFQDRNSETRWVAHAFELLNNKEASPGLLSYVFDPEGQPHLPVRGSSEWRSRTLSERKEFGLTIDGTLASTKDKVPIDPELLICGDISWNSEEERVDAAGWFANRAAVIVDPFWDALKILDSNLIKSEVRENSGHLRYLVSLLAAINGLPREIKVHQSRPGIRTIGMNRLSYFSHSTLSIKLPRDDRVAYARQKLDAELSQSRRPWHEVIGHWRVIEYGRSTHACRHLPTMIEDGVAMCERCQLRIRWIPKHERGDPTLGIIRHTYRVTA